MALIKKIDVDKYFAAKRAMRLGKIRDGEPARRRRNQVRRQEKERSRLCKALPLEHSSPSVSSASIPIVFDSGRNRLLRPPGSRQE